MNNHRKVTFGLVVLNALCAIIWGVLAVGDIVESKEKGLLIMHSICAVIWTFTAIMNYIRYRREKNMEEEVHKGEII